MDGMARQWYCLDEFTSPTRGGGETDNPDSMNDLRFGGMIAVLVERVRRSGREQSTRTYSLEIRDSAISTSSGSWDGKSLAAGTSKVSVVKSSGIHRVRLTKVAETYLCSHGYPFLPPSYRGSSGRGLRSPVSPAHSSLHNPGLTATA